ELPEVQTVVHDLNRKIIGRRILRFWSDWPRAVKHPSFPQFTREIRGAKIVKVSRRAKNILIHLKLKRENSEHLLLIHQKMTGHLLVGKWRIMSQGHRQRAISVLRGPLGDKVNEYVHHIFYLSDGRMLGFSDVRKFGKIVFGPEREIELSSHLSAIGPEPLKNSLSPEKFRDILIGGRRKIKQVLMDQGRIAGIGNIYSDEILFAAKVHPSRRANGLSAREYRAIYKETRSILKKAIKLRGTSISDFRDTSGRRGRYGEKRLIYGREGLSCLLCKKPIKRIKIGSRSAHFCPNCQRFK
ncbi:MAG: DNA-formamidopyrimidine glycosylase, partial [Candidatus Colwellbacteria bacterium]|nr:DNA-formamidopyrimidine glycosylase [Candidatus Colwellbacteria bacterium]